MIHKGREYENATALKTEQDRQKAAYSLLAYDGQVSEPSPLPVMQAVRWSREYLEFCYEQSR